MFKHWAGRYGAEIYAVTGDVIECTVERPPTTRDEAMELAREQFLLCTDIVYQGTESISLLAATLQDCSAWYFWWD